ncbi:hypothetical protein C5167_007887 [Papaver somniferum]|uniref:uncharacterized protein LOC113336253 n=1 Tax=Papaver somniferum TaxID=3469 RepID=UPI000E701080|nr:uncharacterized protein LOC113336253 [Papaver somniferum]RZC89660.1 hypothetical protein C5167_007887 [Papaver somniferum]
MAKSTWEAKPNTYRKWGWSEEQIQYEFLVYPISMRYSEKKISGTMDFLVNQMCISTLHIARCPGILSYNLEKRIIPRSSVYQILISKGLFKEQISLFSLLKMTDESFSKKFLFKYEKEAPELLEASQHRALEVSQSNESILAEQIERT